LRKGKLDKLLLCWEEGARFNWTQGGKKRGKIAHETPELSRFVLDEARRRVKVDLGEKSHAKQ